MPFVLFKSWPTIETFVRISGPSQSIAPLTVWLSSDQIRFAGREHKLLLRDIDRPPNTRIETLLTDLMMSSGSTPRQYERIRRRGRHDALIAFSPSIACQNAQETRIQLVGDIAAQDPFSMSMVRPVAVPSSSMLTIRAGRQCAVVHDRTDVGGDPFAEIRRQRSFPVEIRFESMADRFVQSSRPPPLDNRHDASRGIDR
jgi:hypothetical protein